jgi:hypothetical protein
MAIKFGALDWNKIGALFGHYRGVAAGRRIFSACFVPRQKMRRLFPRWASVTLQRSVHAGTAADEIAARTEPRRQLPRAFIG